MTYWQRYNQDWSAYNLIGKFKALPKELLDREKFYGIF